MDSALQAERAELAGLAELDQTRCNEVMGA